MNRFTLAEISGALSRVLSVSPDSAVIGRFAGQLEAAVNSRSDFQRSGLDGSGFQTLVMSQLPPEVSDLMNPSKLQDMQRRQAERANTNSSEYVALSKFAELGALRGDMTGRAVSSDRTTSSNSYGRELLAGELAKARDVALANGMSWVANNPDLLKLGPAAIQALADVKLKQDSFQRFQQGGLSAKTIVQGARWAKEKNVDLNEASRAYQGTHQLLTPEQQKEHQKATEGLFNSYGAPPAEQEAARSSYNETMEGLKKSNPSAAPQIEREQRVLKTVQQREKAATATANDKEADVNKLLALATEPKSSDGTSAGAKANDSGGKPTHPDRPKKVKDASAAPVRSKSPNP